jgi:hypothetical protein
MIEHTFDDVFKLICPIKASSNKFRSIGLQEHTLKSNYNIITFNYCDIDTEEVYTCKWTDGYETPRIDNITYFCTLKEWVELQNKEIEEMERDTPENYFLPIIKKVLKEDLEEINRHYEPI